MTGRFVPHFIDKDIEIQIDHHLPEVNLLLSSTAKSEARSRIMKSRLFPPFHQYSKKPLIKLAFLDEGIPDCFLYVNSS